MTMKMGMKGRMMRIRMIENPVCLFSFSTHFIDTSSGRSLDRIHHIKGQGGRAILMSRAIMGQVHRPRDITL